MSDHDPAVQAEWDKLRAISESELAAGGKLQELGYLASSEWQNYTGASSVINDYVGLLSGGEGPPPEEWHHALADIKEARRALCERAEEAIQKKLAESQARLAGERTDLENAISALDDVKSAINQAEEAHRLTEVVLKLNELAEFAKEPSFGNAKKVITGTHEGHLIEEGIRNLGQYDVLLTLAAHGFSSVDELDRRVATARQQVEAAAHDVESDEKLQDIATEYRDWVPDR